MNIFIPDPKDNKPSVTLTMMIASFALCLIGSALEMFGFVKSTSMLMEMFMTTSAIYLGRRTSWLNGSKNVKIDGKQEEVSSEGEK